MRTGKKRRLTNPTEKTVKGREWTKRMEKLSFISNSCVTAFHLIPPPHSLSGHILPSKGLTSTRTEKGKKGMRAPKATIKCCPNSLSLELAFFIMSFPPFLLSLPYLTGCSGAYNEEARHESDKGSERRGWGTQSISFKHQSQLIILAHTKAWVSDKEVNGRWRGRLVQTVLSVTLDFQHQRMNGGMRL